MLIMPFEPSHFLQNFDQFAVKHHFRILKMIANSGFLTALNCTKFVLARLRLGPRWGSLQRSSRPLARLRGEERGRGDERDAGEGGKAGRGGKEGS